MSHISKIAIAVFLPLLLGAKPQNVQRVDSSHSSITFTVDGEYLKLSGSFKSFSGSMVTDSNSKPSVLNFKLDMAKFSLNGTDPRASIMAEQMTEAIPSSVLTFTSSSIKEVGPRRFLVSGVSSLNGRKERVNVPVEFRELGTNHSRVTGTLSGTGPVDGPQALLLGDDASGQVQFAVEFFS